MPVIPIINKTVDFAELMHSITARYDALYERLQDEKSQRKLVLIIVATALLLDNMLYMVIVPIIPPYLEQLEKAEQDAARSLRPTEKTPANMSTTPEPEDDDMTYEGEGSAVGILFASKAIIQLLVGPFSGAIIDRIGYDKPMMLGLTIMFFSTAVFACGQSYGFLFFARSLQGVGSAFADTAGLAMIADR
jgi:DHA1 family vesicular acetylcholine transporter-like MFS transporter 3